MSKPQITIRIPPSLFSKLNRYVEHIGTSKTEVVLGALAQYLDCAEDVPLIRRLIELEERVTALEAEVRSK